MNMGPGINGTIWIGTDITSLKKTIDGSHDGVAIPINYGLYKITGKIAYCRPHSEKIVSGNSNNNFTLSKYGDLKEAYACTMLYLIAMGKSECLAVLANDKYLLSELQMTTNDYLIGYLTTQYNDGTGDFIPDLDGANNFDTTYSTRLKGISQQFFNLSKPIPKSTGGVYHLDYWIRLDTRVLFNSSNTSPKMDFVLRRNLGFTINNSLLVFLDPDPDETVAGSNPAAVIYDILTNTQYGLGVLPANIDLTSFNAVADSFATSEANDIRRVYGINFLVEQLTSAKEIIDKIRETTDIFLYAENDKFYLKSLYNKSDSVVATIYDDDCSSFAISFQTWEDVPNHFEGEYIDPNANYERKSVYIKNESAIIMADGYINKKKIDLSYFNNARVASCRLNEIMQRESFPTASVQCEVDRRFYNIKPGDLINVVNDEYGVIGTFRCIEIGYGEIDNMNIKLELKQAFETLFDENYINASAFEGSVPRRTEPAGIENIIFPAFSFVSNARSVAFTNDAYSQIQWGDNQENKGTLIYGIDYIIDSHNRVHLTDGTGGTTDWTATVEANALGLLNVNTWQG